MIERTVSFTSAGFVLAGTLTSPSGGEHAAVMLLSGSGQTDRDGNAPQLAINVFPPLVQALDARGFVTFRFDKRGVGASQGNHWATGFHDRLADAEAAVAWLADQPEVDERRLYVLGHSEGALLAVRLAAAGAHVAGAVLLAGSSKTGEETLLWQGRQVAQTISGINRQLVRLLRIDPEQQQRRYLDRLKATTADSVRIQLVQKVNARWMREFLAYDPEPDLAAVSIPMLAITGTKDIQVDPSDLGRMAELVHAGLEAHAVPDLTHLMRPEAGAPSLRSYKRQALEPVDPRVLSLVGEWLSEQARTSTRSSQEDPTEPA